MNTSAEPNQLELRLLRTFLVLMQERSVSRAALRLNLSQPTMSHALARLRRLFNDPLLLNTYGAMTPTARGSELRVEIEELVARFDQLLASSETFDPATSQMRMSIMAPEFAGDLLAPVLLRRLQHEASGIEVEFVAGDPARAVELLEQGIVDFRLGWWPEPAPALRHKLLWTERLVCISRVSRPGWSSPVQAAEYFDARHVRVKRLGRSFSMTTIDAAAARAKRKIRVSAWVQNASTMANIVSTTDLVGTLSERLAASLPHIDLQISPMPFEVPDLKVALYWHERTHRHPAHRWFRTLLADVVRQQ